jgi:putative DNA primase/helicase
MSALEREKAITKELMRNLRGRWDTVLTAILPELRDAASKGEKKHVLCPYHQQGRDEKKCTKDFRIGKQFAERGACHCTCMPDGGIGDGFQMIMFARDCTFMEAKQMVIDQLGGRMTTSHIPVKYSEKADPQEVERADAELRRKISRYWDEAFPLDHPKAQPVRNWFRIRGLEEMAYPIANLRCHPGMLYMDGSAKLGTFPTLLGMVRSVDGRTCTIHRTYLSTDGSTKAPVGGEEMDRRKQYPAPSTHPVNGAAIRLSYDTAHPVLSVGEGIETMLSAQCIASYPAWSVLNKSLLPQVQIPDYVRAVIVWTDRDRSQAGQAAALELVDRLRSERIRAVAFMPPYQIPDGKKGVDWNDVVMAQGILETQNHIRVLAMKSRVNQILRDMGYETKLRAAS